LRFWKVCGRIGGEGTWQSEQSGQEKEQSGQEQEQSGQVEDETDEENVLQERVAVAGDDVRGEDAGMRGYWDVAILGEREKEKESLSKGFKIEADDYSSYE